MIYLLLKSENVSNTTVDGISNPSEGFITKRKDGIEAAMRRNPKQQLRCIASSENFMYSCKVSRALLWIEIRCKYALLYTFPSKKLARTTRSSATVHLFRLLSPSNYLVEEEIIWRRGLFCVCKLLFHCLIRVNRRSGSFWWWVTKLTNKDLL